MARALLLAVVLLALLCGEARAESFRVVVVPGLELGDLAELEARGAVGLLVPANGNTTSGEQARAALVRGHVESSYLGGTPSGPVLLSLSEAETVPGSGPVIVVGLPEGGSRPNDRRYPIAVLGAGYRGLLTSDSTRIPGLVSITDVGPTALGRDDALGSRPQAGAAQAVLDLDRRIAEKNDARLSSSLLAAALVALLVLLGSRGAAILGFAAGLTANLALGIAGATSLWLVLLVVALAVGVVAPLAAVRIRSRTAVGGVLAGVLVAYLLAMALDGTTVSLSPWGAPQNGRFYGVSNLLETMLLVPALAGAALLTRRLGAVGFALVALIAVVVVAGNRFGADGGGAIVLGVGYAVLAAGLAGGSRRVFLVALAAAGALVAGLLALDALTGASSHVTRAAGGGPGELVSDLGRRLHISWERATIHWYVTVIVAAAVGILALHAARVLRASTDLRSRALPLAFAAAVLTSLVVNDSPGDVAVAGLTGYVAVAMGKIAPDAPLPPHGRSRLPARDRLRAPGRGLRRRGDRLSRA